jgi:hypothetical protein
MTIKARLAKLEDRMKPKKKERVLLHVVYDDNPEHIVKTYVIEVEPRGR